MSASNAGFEPVAGRLSAELASAGYSVKLQLNGSTESCERAPRHSTAGAWVRLEIEPGTDDRVVANICFDGTAVRVEGLKSDPATLAVNAAEAINGLEATAPSFEPPATTRPVAPPASSAALSMPAPHRHAVMLAETVIIDPTGFPRSWGTSLDLELGLGPHASLVIGGFFPIARAELATKNAQLQAGFSFLRIGPALRFPLGDFALSGSVVVGPGFSWVTAEATSPYVGGKDWAFGIWSAVGVQMIYLERSPVFAVATVRGGLLLPSPRFSVPDDAPRDFGPFLIETSLGIGLRL